MSLHFPRAGTSLGDPIEVGAAGSAIYTTSSAQDGSAGSSSWPLTLLASKSWEGHAEPAAGLVAIAHAASAASAAQQQPLLHLRAVNPAVAGAMEAAAARGAGLLAGRQ